LTFATPSHKLPEQMDMPLPGPDIAQLASSGEASAPRTDASSASLSPVQTCDGLGIRAAMSAALAWLEQHADAINALNVFPVPDGDTGTNMVLTLRAALAEVNAIPTSAPREGYSSSLAAGAAMKAIAHGALMGARGNSGVILSQLLRGAAHTLEPHTEFTPKVLAEAFASARDMAYQGVMRPVEGTILTVAKEVAAATQRAARNENLDFRQFLAVAADAARHAVAATPTQLPVLAEAGVVDAGGQGLFIILEGVYRYLSGLGTESNGQLHRSVDLAALGTQEKYGYDTQMIIRGRGLDVAAIREALSSMGDSLLVVGDANTVKVHIHTDRPGDPLNYATRIGSVSDVVIENMQEQYQSFIANRAQESNIRPEKKLAIVAVSQGEGFRRVLESLGADVVVEGGQTMNPSVEELLAAAESAGSDSVILLPNNKNVILAAQHVQAMTKKSIAVVPTRTVPEGISALLALNYELDAAANAAAMAAACKQTQTIEIAVATRAANVNGCKVKEGQYIAILNTNLVAAADKPERAALKAFEALTPEDYEIVTIYWGQGASEAAAEHLGSVIRKRYPDLDVEIVEGGQPHYEYIIAVE